MKKFMPCASVSDTKWNALLFLLGLFSAPLAAQQSPARLEIEQINRRYAALTQLRTEVEYTMFATHSSAKPIDRQTATLARNGEAYLYKLGPVETLTTAAYRISADREDKELLLDKVRGNAKDKQLGYDLDAALAACDTIVLSDPAPGLRMIRMDLAMPDVERIEFRFDASSHLMQKVTLFYREAEVWEEGKPATKARMEIHYKRQDANPVFAKDLFSIERFVHKDKGVLVPAPAFAHYEFFDNTQF